jgi:hypothetical protein
MRNLFALVAVVALAGCSTTYFKDAGAPPGAHAVTLESWPHKDLWTGVVFNGDKVGFTRRQVRAAAGAPGRWEIESEAVMRLQFLGVDKRIRLHAVDRVQPDLTLEAFRYEHEIDGIIMRVTGTAHGGLLTVDIAARGSSEKKTFKIEEPLYPSSALAFLPVTDGLQVGRAARYAVFHGETQAIAEAEQDVLAYETSGLFEGPAFKVATRLLGLETTTWVAADGRPLLELAMQGVLVSALEDEARARRYLVEASLNKRDALVEFSLLRAGPIEQPRGVAHGHRPRRSSRDFRRGGSRLPARGRPARVPPRPRAAPPRRRSCALPFADARGAERARRDLLACARDHRRRGERRGAHRAPDRVDGRKHRQGGGRRVQRRRCAASAARRVPGAFLSLRRVRTRARRAGTRRERHRYSEEHGGFLYHVERGVDRGPAGDRSTRRSARRTPTPRTSS